MSIILSRDEHVCDFCSDPHPVTWYEVEDFEITNELGSLGGWAACVNCETFIDNNQRQELQDYAIYKFLQMYEGNVPLEEAIPDNVKRAHSCFWTSFDRGGRKTTTTGYPEKEG